MPDEPLTEQKVKEIVEKYLSTRLEDVDEIRKSPAGRVLIIETEVKNLNQKMDRLEQNLNSVKSELKREIHGSKNLSVGLFLAILGLIGSVFVKVFFFM